MPGAFQCGARLGTGKTASAKVVFVAGPASRSTLSIATSCRATESGSDGHDAPTSGTAGFVAETRSRFARGDSRDGYSCVWTDCGEVPVDGVHTSASWRNQFSPITFRILDSGHPPRSMAAVRFG